MDFNGFLIHISPLEQFQTKDGRHLSSREIVLQTDDHYPKIGCFTLRNELATNFNHNIGDSIAVKFDISAKPNKEATRYFNTLIAWRIN